MKKIRKMSVFVFCLAAMCLFAGCGVNHGSPEGVVKSLIKYSEKGKEKKVLECYGADAKADADAETKNEADAAIRYFETMKSKGIKLVSSDVIQKFGDCTYAYISYMVKLPNKKEYPKIETFLVNQKEKDYYIIPPKDITADLSEQAKTAYATFMTSDAYKDYQKAYDEFILKNPNFEQELTIKLNN